MTDVYASRAELASALGVSGATGLDDRLDLALIAGSRWVDYYLGTAVTEEDVTAPYTLSVVACNVAEKAATLAAASRFYKSADVPFGVVGGLGDYAVRVQRSIPEAEAILFGLRTEFGFN